MQIYNIGLENIIRLVVDVCVERKYSEKSMEKNGDTLLGGEDLPGHKILTRNSYSRFAWA